MQSIPQNLTIELQLYNYNYTIGEKFTTKYTRIEERRGDVGTFGEEEETDDREVEDVEDGLIAEFLATKNSEASPMSKRAVEQPALGRMTN